MIACGGSERTLVVPAHEFSSNPPALVGAKNLHTAPTDHGVGGLLHDSGAKTFTTLAGVPEKDEGPMTDGIRTAIESASAYLTAHREEARYTDSFARARIEEGLRIRVEGPTGEVLTTDMPGGVGGGGSAPSPGW